MAESLGKTVKCCYVSDDKVDTGEWCENPCNWEIRDANDPDPYNHFHSCDQHLSEMLFEHSIVEFIGEKTDVGLGLKVIPSEKKVT
jgi:hypothetical protein